MSTDYREDNDNRVIADMSDVTRTPLLVPRFENVRKDRRDISSAPEPTSEIRRDPVQLDREERRAMIGGAVSAALLIGGIIAASFAALIFIILRLYG